MLFAISYLLGGVRSVLFVRGSFMSVGCWLLSAVCCLLLVVRWCCALSVVSWLVFAVRCLLCVARCVSSVVCCYLRVACCLECFAG